MPCVITDLVITLDANNVAVPQVNKRVRVFPALHPIFIKTGGALREIEDNGDRILHTDINGQYSITLPWPDEQDPADAQWSIVLPDASHWMGVVPQGVAGPLTLATLKNVYGWGLVSAYPPPGTPPIAIKGPPGTALAPTNVEFSMMVESPAGGFVIERVNEDMILPGFDPVIAPSGFSSPQELGQQLVNPSFALSYNRAAVASQIDDGVNSAVVLSSPFSAGTLPHTYVKSVLGQSVNFRVTANELRGQPKQKILNVPWYPRVYWGSGIPYSLGSPGPTPPAFPNSNFESGSLPPWQALVFGNGADAAISSFQPHSGTRCARAGITSNGDPFAQGFVAYMLPDILGPGLTLTGWYKQFRPGSSAGDSQLIGVFDPSFQTELVSILSSDSAAQTWTQFSVSLDPLVGQGQCTLIAGAFTNGGASIWLDVDDFAIVGGSPPAPIEDYLAGLSNNLLLPGRQQSGVPVTVATGQQLIYAAPSGYNININKFFDSLTGLGIDMQVNLLAQNVVNQNGVTIPYDLVQSSFLGLGSLTFDVL
jgi:hypothetical protein